MEIRLLDLKDDRYKISRIYEESWKSAYRGIIPQQVLDAIPEGNWVDFLNNPEWHTLLRLENGTYIGTCSFGKSRFEQFPDSGEIISLYLMPGVEGKGYGTRLLREAMETLRQQGFREVFLWVLEDNVHARRFYERFGFSATKEFLNDNIGGKELRDVRYVCGFKQIL